MTVDEAVAKARQLNLLSARLDLDGQVLAAELVEFFAGFVDTEPPEHREQVARALVRRIG